MLMQPRSKEMPRPKSQALALVMERLEEVKKLTDAAALLSHFPVVTLCSFPSRLRRTRSRASRRRELSLWPMAKNSTPKHSSRQ